MKYKLLATSLVLYSALNLADVGKLDAINTGVLSSVNLFSGEDRAVPNSSVTLDFSVLNGKSWDGDGDESNVIANCIVGGTITGVKWTDVKLETTTTSWRSEAVISFSDSNGNNAIDLRIASLDESSGVGTYNSNGTVDFTDNNLNDIVALDDGFLPIQFYETYDDFPDAVDSTFKKGTIQVYGEGLYLNPACQFSSELVDLSLNTTHDAEDILAIGDLVVYSQTLSNNGPAKATNTLITTLIPYELTYVSNNCEAIFEDNLLSWQVGDFEYDETLTCEIQAKVKGYSKIELVANVSSDQVDTQLDNNQSIARIFGPAMIIPTLGLFGVLLLLLLIVFIGKKHQI